MFKKLKFLVKGYKKLFDSILQNGVVEKFISFLSVDGKEISIYHTNMMDMFNNLPQAAATKVSDNNYLIVVSTGWMNAPENIKNWVLHHEVGHIVNGHLEDQRQCLTNNFKRNFLPVLSESVLQKEQEADNYATAHCGEQGGLDFFKMIFAAGISSPELKRRFKSIENIHQVNQAIDNFFKNN